MSSLSLSLSANAYEPLNKSEEDKKKKEMKEGNRRIRFALVVDGISAAAGITTTTPKRERGH